MNVLLFSCWYPSKYNPINGIFIREHAKSIKTTNVHIKVLALLCVFDNVFYNKESEVIIDEDGIETHLIYLKSRYYKWLYVNIPFQYLSAWKYFRKNIYSSFQPDIIHSNIIYPSGIIGYFLSKKLNKPHIITEHWSKLDQFFSKNIYSFFGKMAYDKAASISVVSEFLKKRVEKHTVNRNICRVPNVLNNSFGYKQKQIHPDTIVFSAIATWQKPKLPFLMMEAVELLQQSQDKQIEFILVGDGPLLDEMKHVASGYNTKIRFTGNLDRKEIALVLERSDFFLHASEIETFSLVVIEALATGTPVIASNVGGIPELINMDNGLLCENNLNDWSQKINMALAITFNNEEISKKVLKLYSREEIGQLFLELYKKSVFSET